MLQKIRFSLIVLLFLSFAPLGCTKAPPEAESSSPQEKIVAAKQAPKTAETSKTEANKAETIEAKETPKVEAKEAPKIETTEPPKRLNTQDNPAYFVTYSRYVVFGPPRPPVHVADPLAAKDFGEWREVLTYAPEGKEIPFIGTYMDAALSIHRVNNRGMVLIELAQAGEFEAIRTKYTPLAYDYMGFLATLGKEFTDGALDKLKANFERQLTELAPEFGRYIEPMPTRRDRIVGQFRLTQWSFRYETPAGEEKTGCFLMVLMNYSWKMLDMECAPQEWDDQK